MDQRRWYLLVGAAWTILTLGSSTALSDADNPCGIALERSRRAEVTPEDRLQSCIEQNGFKDVKCVVRGGSIACRSEGDRPKMADAIAAGAGTAAGVICFAVVVWWYKRRKVARKATGQKWLTPLPRGRERRPASSASPSSYGGIKDERNRVKPFTVEYQVLSQSRPPLHKEQLRCTAISRKECETGSVALAGDVVVSIEEVGVILPRSAKSA
ncbi:hypothetical protein HPB47_020038 [Ixodes persulcatus]|uniref:Uncharacterized protein n=1 Tax=Ixodes persulcatus TaxID=34615 RepID=A0AC60QK24_IXOPE|nr:hypothetical protein HPB47_020038 [Ixodes persulcatus]